MYWTQKKEIMTEITICSGTLCYIMGGAELFEIETMLEQMFDEKVVIKAAVCLGHCQGSNKMTPPCIEVNGIPVDAATVEKIIYHLQKTN